MANLSASKASFRVADPVEARAILLNAWHEAKTVLIVADDSRNAHITSGNLVEVEVTVSAGGEFYGLPVNPQRDLPSLSPDGKLTARSHIFRVISPCPSLGGGVWMVAIPYPMPELPQTHHKPSRVVVI